MSSNEAGAAARQSAAPAVPALPGLLPVPGVPDHDGGAGPRRKTAPADAGDADAPARAPCPRVDPSRAPDPPPRAPDRDRAAPRAPPRVPAGRSGVFPARGEAFATRAPGFANRRPAPTFPAFQTTDPIDADRLIRADASWLDVELGASEKPSRAGDAENPLFDPRASAPTVGRGASVRAEKRHPRDDDPNACPHALCERFGRDARLGSVDRETQKSARVEHERARVSTNPSRRRSREPSGGREPFGAQVGEADETDESPSRKRRVDRRPFSEGSDDGRRRPSVASRAATEEVASGRSPASDFAARDSRLARNSLSDFGPLMDLLEGRPSRPTPSLSKPRPSGSHRPHDALSSPSSLLFADDARDSVLSANGGAFAGDGGVAASAAGDDEVEADQAARGFVDGLLADAVDGVFGGDAAETSAAFPYSRAQSLTCDCARASVAPRISPPTPRRDTRLDPAAPAFAPKRERLGARSLCAPRTAAGRRIAPPAFADAHFVSEARRAMWAGPSGTLPSAREVLRFVDAVAETQARVGVPPFG